MIYLLYGPDTYRSRQKLNEIIAGYRERAGSDLNLHRFDAAEDDFAALKIALETGSLFSPKKLVVVEQAFSTPHWEALHASVLAHRGSTDTIVVLRDGALGEEAKKRLAEISPLTDKAQEFALLVGAGVERWIRQEAASRGLILSPVEFLVLAAKGGDLWAIANELDKLAVSDRGEKSGGAALAARTPKVFDLGDTFFSAPRQGLRHLLSLLSHGHEDMHLFSYLTNHARTLLAVKISQETHQPLKLGIHPFVVKKASQIVRTLSRDQLHSFFCRFFEEDWRIKVGLSRPQDSLIRMLWKQ